MPITLSLADVKTELEAVPAGNYAVTVASAKEGISKTGNPKIEVKLRIDEPEEQAGRILFDNFSLQPQALWKLKRWLYALGYSDDDFAGEFELDPEELVGLTCVASVIVRPFTKNPGTEQEETVERNNVEAYASDNAVTGLAGGDEDEEAFKFDFD